MRAVPAAALMLLALLTAGPALGVDASAPPREVVDARGERVTIRDTSRIVSVGGAVTEILYALHLQDRIVAVDSSSLYPPQAMQQKPSVGYMRQLSAEGVLGLNPSLMLAAEGSGPKETMAVLKAAAVPLVVVPDRYTEAGVLQKVRLIAEATGANDAGACLAAGIERDWAALERLRARVTRPKKVLFVLSLMNGRPLVAGSDSAADGIIRLAGGVNAMTGYQGYKQVNDEAVIMAQPDAILVMQRGQDDLDADTVFAHPALAATPAAGRRAFIAFDGLYLLGFGPRTARAAQDLARALYPDLASSGASATTPGDAGEGCP